MQKRLFFGAVEQIMFIMSIVVIITIIAMRKAVATKQNKESPNNNKCVYIYIYIVMYIIIYI